LGVLVFAASALLPWWAVVVGVPLRLGGRSLGQRMMGLHVVRADGTPLDRGTTWQRGVLKMFLISGLAPLYAIEVFLSALGFGRGPGAFDGARVVGGRTVLLHDWLSGTVVV